jgi:uncharacterized protein (UPF0305 family)
MSKVVTLTPALLRRIVLEEKARIVAEAKKMKEAEIEAEADEVGADEYADSLVNKIDHAKAAGVKNESKRLRAIALRESALLRELGRLREAKKVIGRRTRR